MKKHKVAVVFLVYFLSQLVISCCDCPKSSVHNYKFESITTSNIDNADEFPVFSETNVIPKEAFGIRLELSLMHLLTCNKATNIGFSQLYAYDCFCPPADLYILSDTICKIEIKTMNDFDESHPSNSILTDYFKVLTNENYYSITDFIKGQQMIENYAEPEKQIIDLFLLTPPVHPGEYRFRIDVTLSDNRTLSIMTQTVNLV